MTTFPPHIPVGSKWKSRDPRENRWVVVEKVSSEYVWLRGCANQQSRVRRSRFASAYAPA